MSKFTVLLFIRELPNPNPPWGNPNLNQCVPPPWKLSTPANSWGGVGKSSGVHVRPKLSGDDFWGGGWRCKLFQYECWTVSVPILPRPSSTAPTHPPIARTHPHTSPPLHPFPLLSTGVPFLHTVVSAMIERLCKCGNFFHRWTYLFLFKFDVLFAQNK